MTDSDKAAYSNSDSRVSCQISETGENGVLISFSGKLDIHTAGEALESLASAINGNFFRQVAVDLSRVEYMDDYGAAAVHHIKRITRTSGDAFRIQAPYPETGGELLNHPVFETKRPAPRSRRSRLTPLIIRLGETAIEETRHLGFLFVFIGSVVMAFLKVCTNPKGLRIGDTIDHMEKTGVAALPIVALISFLLGSIMAFMASIQFRQFGAGVYVASLVGFAMVSELGPIMTAIVVSGRSGSAYAAEIGTMKIYEEIDALITMGFDPTLFLAIPRLIAAVMVVPILTLFSNLFAIFGGMLVGVLMLDLSAVTYIRETVEVLSLKEMAWGTGKSAVFAGLIALIGCLQGFRASGGAAAVGNAATSAVVRSIFFIILFDSLFAVIRSF